MNLVTFCNWFSSINPDLLVLARHIGVEINFKSVCWINNSVECRHGALHWSHLSFICSWIVTTITCLLIVSLGKRMSHSPPQHSYRIICEVRCFPEFQYIIHTTGRKTMRYILTISICLCHRTHRFCCETSVFYDKLYKRL